jgi:hypothetical protein
MATEDTPVEGLSAQGFWKYRMRLFIEEGGRVELRSHIVENFQDTDLNTRAIDYDVRTGINATIEDVVYSIRIYLNEQSLTGVSHRASHRVPGHRASPAHRG